MRSLRAAAVLACICLADCTQPSAAPADPGEPIVQEDVRILDTATNLAYSGFRIARPSYRAELACNRVWGYYSLEVFLGGEALAYTRNFAILDGARETFMPVRDYRKIPEEFEIVRDGASWRWSIVPDDGEPVAYSGRLEAAPDRLELAAEWTAREPAAGAAVPACFQLGRLLTDGCPYSATLGDGSPVEGSLPPSPPAAGTVLLGGEAGIRSITLATRKGRVTISFEPDADEKSGVHLPRLVSDGAVWRLPAEAPAGRAGVRNTYRVSFHFPD